ncbi:MAG: hypothetical protein D3923_02140 [Candidatus Electrothrix sp. AR3]|nr:hypothetical protein [Candidatus Electrothrix sp. AR3]
MKSFSKWTIAEVEEVFDLNQRKHHEALKQWLQVPVSLTPEESNLLLEFRERLQDHVWDWNEW